jgi:hypothetical protein
MNKKFEHIQLRTVTANEGEPVLHVDSKGRIITKKGNIPLIKDLADCDVFVIKSTMLKSLRKELEYYRCLQFTA